MKPVSGITWHRPFCKGRTKFCAQAPDGFFTAFLLQGQKSRVFSINQDFCLLWAHRSGCTAQIIMWWNVQIWVLCKSGWRKNLDNPWGVVPGVTHKPAMVQTETGSKDQTPRINHTKNTSQLNRVSVRTTNPVQINACNVMQEISPQREQDTSLHEVPSWTKFGIQNQIPESHDERHRLSPSVQTFIVQVLLH